MKETITETITGKELFLFLQSRFNMTEKEALNNMEKNGHKTGLIRAELDIKIHSENTFKPLINKMRGE